MFIFINSFPSFDHKHSKYIHNASRIRNLVAETLDIWSKNSLLKFEEVELPESADIIVSFEKVFHPDVDAFAMNDPVLAHAFRPGSGIGGDVHFREDLEWNFEVSYGDQPTDGALSFFSAALHELGHTLGLGHSDKSDAVMYDFYTKSTGILSLDDINGIHHIYGIPPHYNEPTTARPVDTEGHTDFVFPEPDKCDTSYDAIATIRNELFIFKGRYMWRPNSSNDTIEIRKMWSELPENLTYVDAVIENDDGKVLFFIGKDIYGFDGTKFEFKSSLSQLGIDHHFNKIDAIFKWHYNKQTYIFSGTQYWKLDGKMVNRQYPKDILRSWRDVYDIDTAYGTNDKLYFFKGTFFHEFNYRTMRMERMNPQKSAQTFMKCAERPSGIPPRFGDHGDEVLDNGMIEEVLDDENFEKMETFTSNVNETTTPDAAATHNLLVSILLASLAISQVLQSISLYF